MKIGFDATSLCRKRTGIESYAFNLIESLLTNDRKNEYVVLFRRDIPPELKRFEKNARFLICPFDNQIFCEQIWLPWVLAREAVDVVHFPAFPPGLFIRRLFIFTVHDATVWKYPETLSWKGRLYFKPLTDRGIRLAHKVITVSESSKNDIVRFGHIREEKVINCSQASSEFFQTTTLSDTDVQNIRNHYGLPEKFILSVNSLEPRKNIKNLLKAYKMLKDEGSSMGRKLVLVGRPAWGSGKVTDEIKDLGLGDDVIMSGYVPSIDLCALYGISELFIYPSIYEGFGLPPLEAMSRGAPVIASNIQALTETLGDAAYFVDPLNPDSIKDAIKTLLIDSTARESLARKGFERVKVFSWDKVVENVLAVYRMSTISGRVRFMNINIDNLTGDEASQRIELAISNRECMYVVTPNVDHIVKLQRDPEFQKIYDDASLVLTDGMLVLWAARFLGKPLKEKISGSDILPRLCEVSQKKGYKLFFLGGKPGSALKAAEVLKKKHPGLQIVGVYSPPFGFESDDNENRRIIDTIRSSRPDMLFVGLGAPKQEKWIHKYYKELGVPVSIGVGGTFEIMSGAVRRAPAWMQRAGLEWLWRLAMEPKRLWRRYLVEDLEFFWLVLKQKFSAKSSDGLER